jgi:pimeloyl-ACP methyl ester carboxylesterase
MTNSSGYTEPVRPLPDSAVDNEGNLRAYTILSPKTNTTRAGVRVPPVKVIPVIVIAGIMGSNLRASSKSGQVKNKILKPGEQAWRPPNGINDGLSEASKWSKRDAATRQMILDPDTLEVDEYGPIALPPTTTEFSWDLATASARGWGEIHSDSYGQLLTELQLNLNSTFNSVWGKPSRESFWLMLDKFDRGLWGARKEGVTSEITDDELLKFAEYHYPIYGFGYNWLQSNETSAEHLKNRIDEIISFWTGRKRICSSVILVTHSMGGLVARACSKQIPEKILGVIHGVMPAAGAPACYRRVACGTETTSPGKGKLDVKKMEKFADIAGRTSAETTPVLATACGPLELIPNHLYPKPWLFGGIVTRDRRFSAILKLPEGSPYDLYRDMESWYRAIDPTLADPANLYDGEAVDHINKALRQAEKFHTEVLGEYYHPKTYAFCGVDEQQRSFGICYWIANANSASIDQEVLKHGRLTETTSNGGRQVQVENLSYHFEIAAQDASGDGTVPRQS